MKMNLDRAWVYEGRVYGPGEVEVSDDVGKVLKERQGDVQQAEEQEQQAADEQVVQQAASPQEAKAVRKAQKANE